jgi:hypothetical protein
MATQAKIAANRRNALKSTGPRTARGKEMSRRNAVTNGFFATAIRLFPHENNPEYSCLVESMNTDLGPVGPFEFMLARQIIDDMWRLQRLERAEAKLHERTQQEYKWKMMDEMSDDELALFVAALDAYISTASGAANQSEGPSREDGQKTLRCGTVNIPVDAKYSKVDVEKLQAKFDDFLDRGTNYLEMFRSAETAPSLVQIEGMRRALRRDIIRTYAALRAKQADRITISPSHH